jgi:regulator of sigma D
MVLDFLFGNRKTATEASLSAHEIAPAAIEKSAPGTSINFNPDLVPQLKADHQALLATYGRIKNAYEAGDMTETSAHLENFRSQLMAHLLKENVCFYIYLKHALAADPPSQTLVNQFRHEMDSIGKAVMAFLDKYRQIAFDTSLAGSFGADLASIGNVLVQRVRNEEDTLYPLYLPVY